MITERKYRYDASRNEMVKAYTIKEIFQDNWDDFVYEMEKQGKTIRPTIMEEAAKIIGCQDPMNGFALYSCPDCGGTKRAKARFCFRLNRRETAEQFPGIQEKLKRHCET